MVAHLMAVTMLTALRTCGDVRQLHRTNECCGASADRALTAAESCGGDALDASVTDKYPGYALIFSDEFAIYNASRWNNEFGTGADGWGNAELQSYANRAHAKDGALHITPEEIAPGQYESARIQTQYKVHVPINSMVEARIRVPKTATAGGAANGVWPAFWMLGASFSEVGWPLCGGIDIFQLGERTQPDRLTHAVHFPAPSGGSAYNAFTSSVQTAPLHEGFHTYQLNWTATKLTWLLDGEVSASLDVTDSKYDPLRAGDFFVLLNVAIGGRFTGILQPNGIEADFALASMEVDWLRVYSSTTPPSPPSPRLGR